MNLDDIGTQLLFSTVPIVIQKRKEGEEIVIRRVIIAPAPFRKASAPGLAGACLRLRGESA